MVPRTRQPAGRPLAHLAPAPLRAALGALAFVATLAATAPCAAGVLRPCAGADALSPADKDRLFRFGALVKDELERSGQDIALIARSGLDLSRFGHRYSHAGFSLKASDNTPWSVRQLYYACDESKPRIYDQGIAGFVLGTDEPAEGYVSLVFLPQPLADSVARRVLDRRQALQMLSATYSANAYAYSTLYQNCNQWLLEVMALAWAGDSAASDEAGLAASNSRSAAQAWLQVSGYEPSVMDVGWRALMWAASALPWLHNDDHPDADLAQAVYRVSMPASIEAFVRARSPQATRVELCHNARHLVVHRGWDSIADGCTPGPGDTVIALD